MVVEGEEVLYPAAAMATPTTTSSSTSVPGSAESSSKSSRPSHTSRRSLAHHPRLLGLNKDGSLELHGLGISPTEQGSPIRSRASLAKGRFPPQSPATLLLENLETSESVSGDTKIGNGGKGKEEGSEQETNSKNTQKSSHHDLTPIRIDCYGGMSGYQVEQDEESSIHSTSQRLLKEDTRDIEREAALYNGDKETEMDDFDEDDDDYDDEDGQASALLFEPTTAREKFWMWFSVSLVLCLTLVSIAIAVDWIDWPGDGIGKD